MPPRVDDSSDSPDVRYPFFDHGSNLYVLSCADGSVEFRTSRLDEFVRTDVSVPLDEAI